MNKYTKKTIVKFAPYVLVLLGAIAIILAVLLLTKDYKKEDTETTPVVETEVQTTEDNAGFPTVEAMDAMKIDEVIGSYYEAKLNNDADTLNGIVDTDVPYDAASLAYESQYISRYDNFKTYVVPGLTENYFIVYVKYDIFFNGIETGAASLNHFVILKDGDYYHIVDRVVSDEFSSYILETENSETVQNLKKQVEDELTAACESDEKLQYIISVLKGDEEAEVTEAETEEVIEETEEVVEEVTEETEEVVEETSEEAASE